MAEPYPDDVIADELRRILPDVAELDVMKRTASILAALTDAHYEWVHTSKLGVRCWNADKPHRCPGCHAVAVDLERPSSLRVYTCCRCGSRFARWPRLARLLPDVGIRCSEHAPAPSPGRTTADEPR